MTWIFFVGRGSHEKARIQNGNWDSVVVVGKRVSTCVSKVSKVKKKEKKNKNNQANKLAYERRICSLVSRDNDPEKDK